jgi:hypothetical protein
MLKMKNPTNEEIMKKFFIHVLINITITNIKLNIKYIALIIHFI